MHVRRRRALQDTMTAIRLHTTLMEAGQALFPNGERHLRTRQALAAIYSDELLAESVRIARRCSFSLRQLEYQYPHELVPAGLSPASWLRRLVRRGIDAPSDSTARTASGVGGAPGPANTPADATRSPRARDGSRMK